MITDLFAHMLPPDVFLPKNYCLKLATLSVPFNFRHFFVLTIYISLRNGLVCFIIYAVSKNYETTYTNFLGIEIILGL